MKLNIVAVVVLLSCVWLYVLSRRIHRVLKEQRIDIRELEEKERVREVMERHTEGLSKQLLEFVFDTSKVAKLPVDVEFDDVARSMFWAIHGDNGVSVKVKGLEYEVNEHIVIKGETQEILLKVLGIDKTDEVNKTTVLRCDYVSSREKKSRHSYMDLYNMFYILQEDLDNLKESALNDHYKMEAVHKKVHELLDRNLETTKIIYEIEEEHAKEIAKLEDGVNKLTKEAGNSEGDEVHVKVDISEEDIEEIVKKTTNNIIKTLLR